MARYPKKLSAFMQHVKDLWIGPLLKERPKGMSATSWLTFLFHTEGRRITHARASESFTFEGIRMEWGVHPNESVPLRERRIRQGIPLCIRRDSSLSFFEIETPNALWRVTEHEWERIKGFTNVPANWPNGSDRHRDDGGSGMGGVQ